MSDWLRRQAVWIPWPIRGIPVDVSAGANVGEAKYGPTPAASTESYKAYGLGNDCLVFEEGEAWAASLPAVERICNRWRWVARHSHQLRDVGLLKGDLIELTDYGENLPFTDRDPTTQEIEAEGNTLFVRIATAVHVPSRTR